MTDIVFDQNSSESKLDHHLTTELTTDFGRHLLQTESKNLINKSLVGFRRKFCEVH